MTTPRPGTDPTLHELAIAAVVIRHGNSEAMRRFRISASTLREHRHRLKVRLGCETWAEACVLLYPRIEQAGWALLVVDVMRDGGSAVPAR